MAIIADNKMLSKEAKMTAESIRFALLSTMYPIAQEKNGKKYICFSNGKDVVYVSKRSLDQLAFISNLNNACRAGGLKVDLTPYARNKVGETEISRKVYEAFNQKYIKTRSIAPDNALQMFLADEEEKEKAKKIESSADIEDTVAAKLAYIESMVEKFPTIAKMAELDTTMTAIALDAVMADVKHIKEVRQRTALSQFESDEFEK
ncbi:MAG: hypothetical protein IKC11_01830 [Clostridia bacterium]|nr:hypothetical protein [Clostridia bacterium]